MDDTQESGEKLWQVREVSGKGWSYTLHGNVRWIYAKTRKEAKERFVARGYKKLSATRVTAVVSD